MKRFAVTSITRDKVYDLANGSKGSKVLYFTANPNGEAEVVTINLRATGSIKKLKWDIDFADLLIKGRGSKGNLVTKYPVKKIEFKSAGVSTLKPRKIWFDETVLRINVDDRGELLGEFKANDYLLIINKAGHLKTVIPDLSMHFSNDMLVFEKWDMKKPVSVLYFDGNKERYFIKRFLAEEGKEELIISDHPKSQLIYVSTDYRPMAEVFFSKRSLENEKVNFEAFIAVKGIKALGNQFSTEKIKKVVALDPLPYEVPVEEEIIEESISDKENTDDQPSLFDK